EKSLIDVRAMLMNIESIVRGTFPKTIRISFNIPENLWPIYGNRTQIEQVVMNILKNASDAMPHGGDLSLIVENEFIEKKYLERAIDAKEGPYVCITVSDSGEGMSDDVRKRLFEPFFTTKESSKGTGLGLFTSQCIVKAHDGFIRVYSEHGKGSTFKIYLPAITTPEDLEVFKYEADRVSGNGELILVIDDELTICDLIKLVLEDHGYRVIVAVSVEEGERILKEKASEISAILMDLGLFGYESTTIERFVSIDKTVKIIATSGSLINLDEIKKAGINIREFLLKPLAIDKLLLALRRTIDLPS
ncbi:MAG: ATP-binding protein, partial [Candidatus Aenigmatarchaeota archaeon]